ncbi:MAG: sensor histidine kinase [Caloramator sp.]|nr:sensor histidine kinase [Caloramator sp.]
MIRRIDIAQINDIINKIIENINLSREKIFDIIDGIRKEEENLMLEIASIKNKIIKVIDEVDMLEKLDKKFRIRLAEVSRDFFKYTEEDIKKAYDEAYEVRMKLNEKKNEEKILRERRNHLEIQLKKMEENIKNAEKVIHQINVALKYLEGDILPALGIDNVESDMLLGIKILEAQENERKRIARDIHDGPAQYIANAVMRVDFCKKIIEKDINEGLKELFELKEILKRALKEVRDIIFDLRPMSLDDLGLNQTIHELIKSITQEHDLNINLKLKPINDEIEPIIQVAVFRIVQEVLNNIKKHSKAKNVEIKLDYGLKYLMLVVKDDGVGFDVEKTLEEVKKKGESFGLLGIMERVKQLQGDIYIESQKGIGTTFKIKLPVNRKVLKDEGEN